MLWPTMNLPQRHAENELLISVVAVVELVTHAFAPEVQDMDTFANLTVEIAEAKKADDAVLSCSFSFNANQAPLFPGASLAPAFAR